MARRMLLFPIAAIALASMRPNAQAPTPTPRNDLPQPYRTARLGRTSEGREAGDLITD